MHSSSENQGLRPTGRSGIGVHRGIRAMAYEILPYPEEIREIAVGDVRVNVGRPRAFSVVMGASGKASREVHLDALKALNIPLFKRRGGGGTVLLGPNTLVLTVRAGVTHAYRNSEYFSAINQGLISLFRTWCSADFIPRGISDVAVQGKKIVGCSLYRRKHLLLYQGSILVRVDVALMERLLTHPERQPNYRRNRRHAEFVTSLRDVGVALSFETMIADLKSKLPSLISRQFGVIDPAFRNEDVE